MRRLPELFDLRVQARSIAYLFAAGASLGLVTLVFPHSNEVRDGVMVALACCAYVVAAIVWVNAERVREWQIHAVVVTGTVIVSLANYYAGPSTLYPLLYMWTALYAFYCFRLPEALAHMAFIALAYAVVLALQDPDSAIVRWLLSVGTPLVAGILQVMARVSMSSAARPVAAQVIKRTPSPGATGASSEATVASAFSSKDARRSVA